MINQLRSNFDITELCDAFDISRSGYYAAQTRPKSSRAAANDSLGEQIQSLHQHRHTRAYGSPRMTHQLRENGIPCSENRVARLMRIHGLRARPRRPFRPKTTDPDHSAHPSKNLLAHCLPPTEPGQQIVSDITYIPTAEGWLYLAIVLDLFSRAVLAWKVSDSLHSNLVCGALSQAMATGLVTKSAIFHSDRGCQYSSSQFRTLLSSFELRQSMSAKGCCYDNAFAESTFASVKNEVLPDDHRFVSRHAARIALFDYFETFYNSRRLHSSLDYVSPHTFLKNFFLSEHHSLN